MSDCIPAPWIHDFIIMYRLGKRPSPTSEKMLGTMMRINDMKRIVLCIYVGASMPWCLLPVHGHAHRSPHLSGDIAVSKHNASLQICYRKWHPIFPSDAGARLWLRHQTPKAKNNSQHARLPTTCRGQTQTGLPIMQLRHQQYMHEVAMNGDHSLDVRLIIRRDEC